LSQIDKVDEMLTSVTKIVDKSFVVGFVVPVLLAAVGILATLRDLDSIKPFYGEIVQTSSFSNLTIIALLLWAVAILLLILNHHLYRVLEGYSGPFSWVNKWKEQARA
jgi:ABC-type Fe3+ transport system permease subunit